MLLCQAFGDLHVMRRLQEVMRLESVIFLKRDGTEIKLYADVIHEVGKQLEKGEKKMMIVRDRMVTHYTSPRGAQESYVP